MSADQKRLDPRVLELLHKVADGSADPDERKEWTQLLDAAPELGPEFEAVRRLVRQMDALPLMNAPATLKPDIMLALRQRYPSPAAPLANATTRKPSAPRRWQRPALAWAAGLVLIAGTAYFLDRHSTSDAHRIDPSDVSGSMVGRDHRSWRVVETHEPPASGTGLTMVLRRDGDRFAVEARSSGDGNTGSAEIHWDSRALECVAVEPQGLDLVALNQSGSVRLNPANEGGSGPLRPMVIFRYRAGFNKSQEVILLVGGREYHRATIPAK